MLRKNLAVLVISLRCRLLRWMVRRSPAESCARTRLADVVSSSSMSESTSLLLFGSGLWALAMLRRQRRQAPSVSAGA